MKTLMHLMTVFIKGICHLFAPLTPAEEEEERDYYEFQKKRGNRL